MTRRKHSGGPTWESGTKQKGEEGKLLLDQGYALLRLARSSPCDGFLPDGLNVLQQAEPANPLAGLRRLLWRLMELHPTLSNFSLDEESQNVGPKQGKGTKAHHQERP